MIVCHLRQDRRHIQDEDFVKLCKLRGELHLEISRRPEMVGSRAARPTASVWSSPRARRRSRPRAAGPATARPREDRRQGLRTPASRSAFRRPRGRRRPRGQGLGAEPSSLHDRLRDGAGQARQRPSSNAWSWRATWHGDWALHAGHGLDYHNVRPRGAHPPHRCAQHRLLAIIARSVFVGLKTAVSEMKQLVYPSRRKPCAASSATSGQGRPSPLLMEGLKRLEYRGYDSAGLAWSASAAHRAPRAAGKLEPGGPGGRRPAQRDRGLGHRAGPPTASPPRRTPTRTPTARGSSSSSTTASSRTTSSSRTRWPPPGHSSSPRPTPRSWPTSSRRSSRAGRGRAAHAGLQRALFFEAARQALGEVRGAYALAVLWSKAPGVIVAAKTASPLIIGLGDGENFLASDVPAFLSPTRKAVVFSRTARWRCSKPRVCRSLISPARDREEAGQSSAGTGRWPRRAATATSCSRRSTSSRRLRGHDARAFSR